MLNQCIFYKRVSIKLLICNKRYSENIVNMVNQIICPSYYYLTNSILFFSCKIRILINLNCNLFNFSLFQFCTAMFIVCLPIRIMPLQLMVLQRKICETVFKVGLTTVFFYTVIIGCVDNAVAVLRIFALGFLQCVVATTRLTV